MSTSSLLLFGLPRVHSAFAKKKTLRNPSLMGEWELQRSNTHIKKMFVVERAMANRTPPMGNSRYARVIKNEAIIFASATSGKTSAVALPLPPGEIERFTIVVAAVDMDCGDG